jgi:hypothetical protein
MSPIEGVKAWTDVRVVFTTSCCGDTVDGIVRVPTAMKRDNKTLYQAIRHQLNDCARFIKSAEDVDEGN